MKKAAMLAVTLSAATSVMAGPRGTLVGEYVEARTAEVFTGGCIMGSEAETVGKEAVLAWRISRGAFDGVPLDGLVVVAAVAGDRNLGIREIGGVAPSAVRAAVLVDARATAAQRDALVALVREMTGGLVDRIAEVKAVPITFAHDAQHYLVSAGEAALDVATEVTHTASCGAMQWFQPFTKLSDAAIGLAETHVYTGAALGARWQQDGRRSAFFGTFEY
jgi:hypothetical protein